MEAPVAVGVDSLAAGTGVGGPGLAPVAVVGHRVGVTVGVGGGQVVPGVVPVVPVVPGGQVVPVDVVDVAGVLGVVLDELADDEGGDGGGDPLPGVDAGLQPYVGAAGTALGDGQHVHLPALVRLADLNDVGPLVGIG